MVWELAVIILVVVAALLTAKYLPRPPTPSAEEILKERYARGEIDGDEYSRRKHDLEADSSSRGR